MGRIRLTGATSGYTELRAASTAGNNTITLPTTNGGEVVVSDSSGNVNIDSGTFYVDATNNRVGVGSNAPSYLLDLLGSAPRIRVKDSSTGAAFHHFENNSGNFYLGIDNSTGGSLSAGNYARVLWSQGAYPLVFATNDTQRAQIDSSGRLLVGTSSALGPSTTSTGITFYPGDYSVMSSAGNEPLTLNRNNDGSILSCRRSGVNVGSISVTTSATAFNTSSDYRLKENVEPVTDGIARLQQLKPSRFNFIAEPGKTVDGFIAHEAQSVVPECVTGEKDAVDEEGKPIYQGIDQSKLVPLLTAALQEAIGEIESLKARVVALESA